MHIPDQESRGHISPTPTYFIVGVLLLILTAITVAASYVDWGTTLINILIAMAIASVKASLVIMYFMHMKYEDRIIWIFGIVYPIVLFAILVTMASIDVFLRIIPQPQQTAAIESAITLMFQ